MTRGSVDQIYRDQVILDHCRNPRNQRIVKSPDITGDAVNPFCGDEIHIQIRLWLDDLISEISFQGEGCAINIASGSLLSDYIKGMSILQAKDELVRFTNHMRNMDSGIDDLDESLGELSVISQVKKFPVRIKCALLAWSALDDGLGN